MITDAILLGALERAAAAHGAYEEHQLGGIYDESWPEWYAHHMAASLQDKGFGLDPSLLAEELRNAAAAHGRRDKAPDDPDTNWPAWYVTHMMPAVLANVATV
jgi:hypothetical protein